LRRFLIERGHLPDKPLTAGIPVSVRPKDDQDTGNAISFIVSTLGTDIEDATQRLQAIKTSVRHAKSHVQSLPQQAMLQYTLLLMAPTIVTLLTGIGGRTRPMFNVTVSNVPGPDKPLYFRGAELLSIFPASIVTHGQALNITCESYAGTMNFGFTGCHTSLPSMQHLAVYAADALQELEDAILPKPAAAKKKANAPVATKTAATKRAAPATRVRKLASKAAVSTRRPKVAA
jgi:WS/DGAT/MGAT family acyltransferase